MVQPSAFHSIMSIICACCGHRMHKEKKEKISTEGEQHLPMASVASISLNLNFHDFTQ